MATTKAIQLFLKEQTSTFDLTPTSPPSFEHFLDQLGKRFGLERLQQVTTSFTYEDEENDEILVSSAQEYADFLAFVDRSALEDVVVHLVPDEKRPHRSKEVEELLEKVKAATKADPSIARDLKSLIREVCEREPDQNRRRFPSPHWRRRGGHAHGHGGRHSRECDGSCRRSHLPDSGHDFPGSHRQECYHDFPHFVPPVAPHFHPPPPPPRSHHHENHHMLPPPPPPPPPPMWAVERKILERWSQIPPGPASRQPGTPHGPPPPPPPAPFHLSPLYRSPLHGPPCGFEGMSAYPPPPRHLSQHTFEVPPPGLPRPHRYDYPEHRSTVEAEEGWETDFENLRV